MEEKYGLVGIIRSQVLTQITAGKTIYAFNVPKGMLINCDNKTIGNVKEYVNDVDFLFFRINEVEK